MHKIVVAITGASGSICFKILLDKLATLKSRWESVAVVMTIRLPDFHCVATIKPYAI